ncbi:MULTISPECIES: motility associated factor glycosyltransferase family protein [Paenibacillus]|uniref:motility associated factor glycosyltransferase family protein n=1 Tax=Paenibacillus TaxID=44249 RepID=UPI002FE406CA
MEIKPKYIIQQRFPHLLQLKSNDEIQILPAGKGDCNLMMVHKGVENYMYDQVSPKVEIANWMTQFEHVMKESHVLFFGVGLGGHISAFRRKHPEIPFSVFEPCPGIMSAFLEHSSPNEWEILSSVDEIMLGDPFEKAAPALAGLIDRVSRILVVVWPAYMRMFPKELEQFNNTLRQLVNYKQHRIKVNQFYEKEWALNSLHNMPFVLNTPNFLKKGESHLEGKPVVIVSAGPSLNDEIEHLRTIKEKGLAYIFSVGSAVNALIEHGIYPHATFSYDPNPYNVDVIKKIIDKRIDKIPIVFGSTVGRNTLDSYPGPKMHVIITQDEVSMQLLRSKSGETPPLINDAPSVAVIALQCMIRMKAGLIILVGQNLAYRNRKYYASGITNSTGIPYGEGMTQMEGVNGGEVISNPSFIKMKREMEFYIHSSPGIEFINTTRDGAQITGTKFLHLDEVIKLRLQAKTVDAAWMFDNASSGYDIAQFKRSLDKLQREGELFQQIFGQLQQKLMELANWVKFGLDEKVNVALAEFDDLFAEMIGNPYFKLYILPRNRSGYEFLYSKMNSIRNERQALSRAQKVVLHFGDFVWSCQQDYAQSKDIISRFHISNRG